MTRRSLKTYLAAAPLLLLSLATGFVPGTTLAAESPLAGQTAVSAFERVTFPNKHITLVGNLFLPPDFDRTDRTKTWPALVCMHHAGSVKEQTAGLYADRLAQKGFVTLVFDGSFTGESGGEPRENEDPFARLEDIHCAVDYLVTLPFVDENRIGAMGLWRAEATLWL